MHLPCTCFIARKAYSTALQNRYFFSQLNNMKLASFGKATKLNSQNDSAISRLEYLRKVRKLSKYSWKPKNMVAGRLQNPIPQTIIWQFWDFCRSKNSKNTSRAERFEFPERFAGPQHIWDHIRRRSLEVRKVHNCTMSVAVRLL